MDKRAVIVAIIVGTLTLTLGVIIGYFGRGSDTSDCSNYQADRNVGKKIIDEIDASNIESYLRILTSRPHIAGNDIDEVDLVKYVADIWRNSGLTVEIYPYEVLLSYPNEADSNYVSMVNENGDEIHKSNPIEKILDQSQNTSDVVNPFNAYSAAGDPQGKLVYVNYARVEDFIQLQRNLSVNVTGKICIARYGKIFRGNKGELAQRYGCIGLIIYSDPAEYTVPGQSIYPDGIYLPGTGVQRGTISNRNGDPNTPDYPSFDTAWRLDSAKNTYLPKIVVTPIGYDDAVKYLSRMGGQTAPTSWQGGLNITYRLGPGFAGEHNTSDMRMHVTTSNQVKTIHNVVGFIEGSVEPDRYVIYGNHRDAWVFGAMDPSSGTAAILELARTFGVAVRNGWKPRRTIVFCSWGAEEYGLIGSTEWVEEFQKVLGSRAVIYINTDSAIVGHYSLFATAVPSLKNLIYDVTKSIANPDHLEVEEGRTTIYDTWKRRIPANFTSKDSKPLVRLLGSGSDFTAFMQTVGVSSIDISYTYNITSSLDYYPVYHSVYETFDYMKTFIDPNFKYHRAVTQVLSELGRRMTDVEILPFDCNEYASVLIEQKNNLQRLEGKRLKANNVDTDLLDSALNNFKKVTMEFHERIKRVDRTNVLAVRAINDQLMQLERAFIDINGLPGRRHYKHVILAPSQHDTYASSSYPGFIDSLFDIDADPDQKGRWDEVRRQYSILLYHIGSATSTLQDFVPMKGYSNRYQKTADFYDAMQSPSSFMFMSHSGHRITNDI